MEGEVQHSLGGTAFFKKDQIVDPHPEETTDAGPGPSLSDMC